MLSSCLALGRLTQEEMSIELAKPLETHQKTELTPAEVESKDPDLVLNKVIFKQGEFIMARVDRAPEKPRLWFNAKEYEMFMLPNVKGTYRALIPVENLIKPGRYSVLARIDTWSEKMPIQIALNGKEIQHITLSPSKSGLQASPTELKVVRAALNTISQAKQWSGRFIYPSQARKSSPFGVKRSYNNAPVTSYHKGIDFAGSKGSSVVAPAAGTVVATGLEAKGFVVNGNIVIIDHGHGLTTAYLHLHEILVKKGQVVQQGDQIGTVGHTGISTGPHLHWGTYLYGISTDPELFVRENIL